MSLDLTTGTAEELKMSSIAAPKLKLRQELLDIEELALSISSKGLLQPIIVRPQDGKFELVAGSRRFAACKLLGWRKISCQIIEANEQESFEVALAENIARNSLDPVEEAKAFDIYIKKYGWGSETQLAKKIGKSAAYISKRLRLLSLPPEMLEKLFRRRKNPSLAEEIMTIRDTGLREQLVDLSSDMDLSSKDIRRIGSGIVSEKLASDIAGLQQYRTTDERKHRVINNAIQRTVIALRIAMHRLDDVIDSVGEEEWVLKEILLQQRQSLHTQIDLVGNLKKRFERLSNFRT